MLLWFAAIFTPPATLRRCCRATPRRAADDTLRVIYATYCHAYDADVAASYYVFS